MVSPPSSSAFATATTMPLSLKEPVGLQLSSLKYSSSQPTSSAMLSDLTSGVSPSPRGEYGRIVGEWEVVLVPFEDSGYHLAPCVARH